MFHQLRFHRLTALPALAAYIAQAVTVSVTLPGDCSLLTSGDQVIAESGAVLQRSCCCCSADDGCCCASESAAEELPACGCGHRSPVPAGSHVPERSDDVRVRFLSAGAPDDTGIPVAVAVGARRSVPCRRPVCLPECAAHILHCVWTT